MPASLGIVDRKDPRFDMLKKGRNQRFPATDADAASRIMVCSDAAETADALQQIITAGLRPTIRSGNHCYEDFVVNNPNGAIIDLSLHNSVDSSSRGIRISPGASLGEVYTSLYKHYNLTIPGGTCATVGSGGHISGGGYGLLSRLHGLTCDWITGVDILTVDANGKVTEHQTDKTHNADLFRACRGAGGGNFGVITNFYFEKLPPAPHEVAETSMSIPWSTLDEAKFTKFMVAYGDWWAGRAKDPDTWGLFTILDVGPASGGNGHISMGVQFCNPDGGASDLTVLHEFFGKFAEFNPEFGPRGGGGGGNARRPVAPAAAVDANGTARRAWIDATVQGGGGGGQRSKYKSAYMKETFTPSECSAVFKFMNSPDMDSAGAVMAVDSYGGATNNHDRLLDTASAQRSSVMKLQFITSWRDKAQDASKMKFMDDFYTALYSGPEIPAEYKGTPFGPRFEGCYMNYPDVDMLRYKHWPQLYYGTGDLYPFLQRVKKQYDPNNVFHGPMTVRV